MMDYMNNSNVGFGYDYPANNRMGMSMSNEGLVKTIQNCEAVCEDMTRYVKRLSDFELRIRQACLLRDCADICGLTAKFVARNSMFARQLASLCGNICEACGNECLRFNDKMSQNCAQVCLHCARECRLFASS